MRAVRLRNVALCAILALLSAIPARADSPQPIESIDAWMGDFMTCFRGGDDRCLRDTFAKHWHPIPDLETRDDDAGAFFAFLEARMAFAAPDDPLQFQNAAFDERIFSKTFIVAASDEKHFVLTIGAWLVDEELYLFRAQVMDDLMNPGTQIDLIDLSP